MNTQRKKKHVNSQSLFELLLAVAVANVALDECAATHNGTPENVNKCMQMFVIGFPRNPGDTELFTNISRTRTPAFVDAL